MSSSEDVNTSIVTAQRISKWGSSGCLIETRSIVHIVTPFLSEMIKQSLADVIKITDVRNQHRTRKRERQPIYMCIHVDLVPFLPFVTPFCIYGGVGVNSQQSESKRKEPVTIDRLIAKQKRWRKERAGKRG